MMRSLRLPNTLPGARRVSDFQARGAVSRAEPRKTPDENKVKLEEWLADRGKDSRGYLKK